MSGFLGGGGTAGGGSSAPQDNSNAPLFGNIGMGTTGAGGLASAYGSYMQGQATQQADYANARIEAGNATSAELAAKSNAAEIGTHVNDVLGETQANTGASGVQATGSPLAVMHDIASRGALAQKLTIWKGQNAARADLGQAAIDSAEGAAAAKAGKLAAGATILTTAGQVAGMAALGI